MKFFKNLIAATLGVLIAAFLIFIIFFITIISSTDQPEPYVRDNTVLKIDISGNLPAKAGVNPIDQLFNPERAKKVSLESLEDNLKKAVTHDKIKGILLNINFVTSSWAHLQEAHEMISEFRENSDKFVYASTNDLGYNEAGYFLASAADSVFSPPESIFEFDGFYTQVTFYKGLLDNLNIETEITRHGKYKSAVEPYLREDLSEESEYQLQQILNDVNTTFAEAVSRQTDKSVDQVHALLNDTPTLLAHYGYENGLIDSLVYPDELESIIKKRIGLSEDRSFHTITNDRYFTVESQTAGLSTGSGNDKIAVIYANGPILPSPDSSFPFDNQPVITASSFRDQLENIREDDNIKALVIRINSPGGSASTSDMIWRMLRNTSEEIPVVTSMGSVAASGGYYIGMAADSIVAQPTTITGSIGVFSTKFNTRGFFNEKLGITFDEVKSHEHADWLNPNRELTPTEEKAFQQFTDRFYQTFISKVARSRNLTTEHVDNVAQGRVWTGQDAQEQQLVDLLGGLEDALGIAAEKAGIEEYSVITYPKSKDLYEMFMGSAQAKVKTWFGDLFWSNRYTEPVRQALSTRNGELLYLFPYELKIR